MFYSQSRGAPKRDTFSFEDLSVELWSLMGTVDREGTRIVHSWAPQHHPRDQGGNVSTQGLHNGPEGRPVGPVFTAASCP